MVRYRSCQSLHSLAVAVAISALSSVLAIACGSDAKRAESEITAENIAAAKAQGPSLYAENRCADCHGRSREGSELAPPLTPLDENWTEESLTRFLLHPKGSMARHPGVDGMGNKYPKEMPGVIPGTSETEAELLARYLIHQD